MGMSLRDTLKMELINALSFHSILIFMRQKTPVIVADTNPSTLATNFHFLYHPLPQIKLETKMQTGRFPNNSDLDDTIGMAEFLGRSSTISLTLYNPRREAGRMTIGCLYNFNKNFCAGAELLHEWISDQHQYNLAVAAR